MDDVYHFGVFPHQLFHSKIYEDSCKSWVDSVRMICWLSAYQSFKTTLMVILQEASIQMISTDLVSHSRHEVTRCSEGEDPFYLLFFLIIWMLFMRCKTEAKARSGVPLSIRLLIFYFHGKKEKWRKMMVEGRTDFFLIFYSDYYNGIIDVSSGGYSNSITEWWMLKLPGGEWEITFKKSKRIEW